MDRCEINELSIEVKESHLALNEHCQIEGWYTEQEGEYHNPVVIVGVKHNPEVDHIDYCDVAHVALWIKVYWLSRISQSLAK